MKMLTKILVLVLVSAALSLFGLGCESQHEDHPKSDHPKSEHPKSDHPKSDHPG